MSKSITFCRQSQTGMLSVRGAGRLGGLAVLQKHGRNHFAEIGKLGQKMMRSRNPNMASTWGRQGGRPKKLTLKESSGEKGK